MDWYEIAAFTILPLIVAIWGGWRLWKHIPREVGMALIEIADAVEDDRLTIDEIRAIIVRFHRIINIVRNAFYKIS